jgi:hypothetical protein
MTEVLSTKGRSSLCQRLYRHWRVIRTVTGGRIGGPVLRRIEAGSVVNRVFVYCAVVVMALAWIELRADQVEMQNGDHYFGKLLSLDTNTVVLQSDMLGPVRLPRGKVALIRLGSNAPTNLARVALATNVPSSASSVALTNGTIDLSAAFRQLGANTNFIQQVQSQFLGAAGPEANNKFNELVGGLMSGRLTVNDIRAEAKSAADQLKELKRELGEDGGWALDGYLAILENFLQQTASSSVSATNIARPLPKTRTVPDQEED